MEEEPAEVEHSDKIEAVNVCVAVRCRPMSPKELANGDTPVVHFPASTQIVLDTKDQTPHPFQFDHVFNPETSQDHIFDMLGKPLLDKAFDGYNSTIFAYGQTGSGKTHTMMNHKGGPEERGLIPRINEGLFSRVTALSAEHETRRFLVCCSFLEIYNEVIYDLLVPRSKQTKGGGLEIREQKGIGTYVKDLMEVVVETPEKLAELIEKGFEHRMTAATKMNDSSSRSHCIFVIKLHQKDAQDDSKNTFSKVNLVDLAGSERAKATEAVGERLKEGANINKSLSALGNVINALSSMGSGAKKVFVPYRNSKLTRVLQESLGGNSLCTMVAAMSPAGANAEESLSTLNYARRAKAIKVTATKNEEASQIKKLEDEVNQLKQKLEAQACLAATASMSSKEKEELESKYVTQIEELQNFMKQSWQDKQKLSEQYEEEQKHARENQRKAAERMRTERRRRLQLLEQKGDIELSLQALSSFEVKQCQGWPDMVQTALKAEQKLRTQLHAVRLFRESAGTDFTEWWTRRESSDPSVVLTLLGQVLTKLGSMTKELDTLAQLEVQLEEQMGQITPQVGRALHDAQAQLAAHSKNNEAEGISEPPAEEEVVQLLSLVQRQLAQHHAKGRGFLRSERRQLGFARELPWLLKCFEEDSPSQPDEKSTKLVEDLQATAAAAKESTSAQAEAVAVELPSVLGLSTLEHPDDRLGASSNAQAARCARLLQVVAFGGWCPEADRPEEYLEVDLGSLRRVTGLSLQGREPCTSEWSQTRDLLRLCLDPDEPLPSGDKLPTSEKFYKRPPVRLVHDVGIALAQRKRCFGDGPDGWEVPAELQVYPDLSREQKVAFFDELIRRISQAWPNHALSITTQDILSGKNCEESNRLLQLLAYSALRRTAPGLGDASPQWVKSWIMEYLAEDGSWKWCSKRDGNGAQKASQFDGNTDTSTVKFVRLAEPLTASRLRIHPVTWHHHAGFRCEVHFGGDVGSSSIGAGSRPASAAGKRSGESSLERSVVLVSDGIVEVQKRLQERQRAQQAEEDAKAAAVMSAKDKAEAERDLLQKRLQDALARVEDLERNQTAIGERSSDTETKLLQMTVERDRLQADKEQLEGELQSEVEGRRQAEEQASHHRDENQHLQSTVEDLTSQFEVMTEERDLARTKEEELFDILQAKEEELMDANNGYVYLTERLQELEEELEKANEQLRDGQDGQKMLAERCDQLQAELMELRVEHMKVRQKLTEEERRHKAAQDRFVKVLQEQNVQFTGTASTLGSSGAGAGGSRPVTPSTSPSTATDMVHPKPSEPSAKQDGYEEDFDPEDEDEEGEESPAQRR